MSDSLWLLGYGGIILCGFALGITGFALALNPVSSSPRLGLRGLKRQKALARGGLFASAEPLIRFVAALVAHLPIDGLRRRIDARLVRTGDSLGLTPDEHLALCAISGIGLALLALFFHDLIGTNAVVLIFVFGSGAILPHMRLNGEAERRAFLVNRSLPPAIDLGALCMGAGLDFPGALRQILEKALSDEEPLHEEILRILQHLELGRTRREALESFAERVPSEPVKDFVSAVIQAEEKGSPLAEVLRTQASVLRMRRSFAAEEAASRAGVMMMIPLMMIFGAILLILMGPFILGGMESGF